MPRRKSKRCNRCKRTKNHRYFAHDTTRYDGLQSYCKQCRNEAQNVWRQKHPAKWRDMQRDKWLKKLYGISLIAFRRLLKAQEKCCAICRTHYSYRAFDVDHNHHTGKVRGVLCSRCNRGLGAFHDSPSRLRDALTYLAWHGEN
jgi:hypothetical protein